MATFLNRVITWLIALSLIIFSFVTILDIACFNDAFYTYEFNKNEVAETIGISDSDLERAKDVLLAYIRGTYDNLDIEVVIDDEAVAMFNEKEIAHMVDVRSLYMLVSTVRYIALVILVVGLIYIALKKENRAFSAIKKAYVTLLSLLAALIGVLVIYALSDFTSFWNTFHRIFFTNDLWILNPNTDRLIMMVPQSFFFDLVIMIVVLFVMSLVMMYCLLNLVAKKELHATQHRSI